jgi:hypothetical protein
VAWVYFSNEWGRPGGREFPLAAATWITDAGAVPFIRLMLRSSTEPAHKVPETQYTLDRILRGEFDKPLSRWADQAGAFGGALLVEYGTECNGRWMPWNAAYAGGDGTRKFREVYQRIVKLMADATNITWVFHVNVDDNPPSATNRLEDYYPSDDFVDWVAVSCYGAQVPGYDKNPEGFAVQMNRVYPRLQAKAPSKPLIVAEFGCTAHDPQVDPRSWADAALMDILNKAGGDWANLIGFAWWNSYWDNDADPLHDTNMLVQKIAGLPEVFQRRLADSRVQTDALIPRDA